MKGKSVKIYSVLLLFICLYCPYMQYGDIPEEEREALIALYSACSGDQWSENSGWKEEPLELDGFGPNGSENKWTGVTVKDNHVTGLVLREVGSSGPLPSQLSNLKHLEVLEMKTFAYNSKIPAHLGDLEGLRELKVIGNFTGPIPPQLGNLANLETLDLNGHFTGTIPVELGNLEMLRVMRLQGNFRGQFPAEIGKLSSLTQLMVIGKYDFTDDDNQALSRMSHEELREYLRKRGSHFGYIPPELGNLTQLESLMLSGNFSGTIPPQLGKLRQLKYLHLLCNLSEGLIPPELGNLSNLRTLTLSGNRLTGSIPPELGNLVFLETLDLSSNHIEGPIPSHLANLANLKFLRLDNNHLTDTIPAELGNLEGLTRLSVKGNLLSGEVSPNLAGLSPGELKIDYNALYSKNDMVLRFLKIHNPNWYKTQTVAPDKIKAEAISDTAIRVSWEPIEYKDERGCYMVYYFSSPRDSWQLSGKTANKKTCYLDVTGLQKGKKYYFVVQTITQSHFKNANDIYSSYSKNVFAIIHRSTQVDSPQTDAGNK